jgi:hypothetical protein
VRKQEKEVVPFSSAKGYLAVTPGDFAKIISACPQP